MPCVRVLTKRAKGPLRQHRCCGRSPQHVRTPAAYGRVCACGARALRPHAGGCAAKRTTERTHRPLVPARPPAKGPGKAAIGGRCNSNSYETYARPRKFLQIRGVPPPIWDHYKGATPQMGDKNGCCHQMGSPFGRFSTQRCPITGAALL